VSHCRRLFLVLLSLTLAGAGASIAAHDVPDRSFDRSIQITVHTDRIHVSYHLSLTQLTLAEELLALVGPGGLSGAGAAGRMEVYAEKMGPLLADGLLVRVNGAEQKPRLVRATHRIEDHPRFFFDLELPVEPAGGEQSVTIEDTSFFMEKGRLRIALRAESPAELVRSTVPADVERVQTKSSWELTPVQQDTARRAEAAWRISSTEIATNAANAAPTGAGPDAATVAESSGKASQHGDDLLSLLDRWSQGFYFLLLGIAFLFGAAHAMTPGHGKTMVAAYLVGERGTLRHAVGLGLTTSLTHTSSVLVVALLLWLIGDDVKERVHSGFALASGVLVAGLGAILLVTRLTSRLRQVRANQPAASCGHSSCSSNGSGATGDAAANSSGEPGWGGLLTLGISGGIVPCWDAVVLLLIAMAQGQVDRAVYLLLSFSAGLASALVGVGVLAVKLRGFLAGKLGSGRIVQSLPVVSAAAILAVGIYLCASTLLSPAGPVTLDKAAANRMAGP